MMGWKGAVILGKRDLQPRQGSSLRKQVMEEEGRKLMAQ
jgi:hypothetical protein